MRYQTQIKGTEPDKWIHVRANTPQDAAINAVRRVGVKAVIWPCQVYVGDPTVRSHDNGSPIVVHAFTLAITRDPGTEKTGESTGSLETERGRLEAECERASASLKQFPRSANGLTPDDVRSTPEWKSAKSAWNVSFKRLRQFNQQHARTKGNL